MRISFDGETLRDVCAKMQTFLLELDQPTPVTPSAEMPGADKEINLKPAKKTGRPKGIPSKNKNTLPQEEPLPDKIVSSPITMDELVAALKNVMIKKGPVAAQAIVRDAGFTKVAEIPHDKYSEIYIQCEAVLAQ
jgi:hypothetical protein